MSNEICGHMKYFDINKIIIDKYCDDVLIILFIV